MSIQAIEKDSTQGWQVRVFRSGRMVKTAFLAYLKNGGKEAAYLLAKAKKVELEAEVTAEYGPAVRAKNPKGKHHQNPASNNRSKMPGISIDYHVGGRRHTGLVVHVRWMEGDGQGRKQHHTTVSVNTYGIKGALQRALDKRFEKTGIPQPTVDEAWLLLRDSIPQ